MFPPESQFWRERLEQRKQEREDWKEVELEIMRKADLAKFTQNPRLRQLPLATEEVAIIEDTTTDSFWGIVPHGFGENWAGKILMEVRAALRIV